MADRGSPRPTRGLSFALQLSLFVFLPLAAVAVIIPLASLSLHDHAMRTLVAERDQRAVRAAAATLQQQLIAEAQAVGRLARLAASQTPESALLQSAALDAQFTGPRALLAADGSLLAASDDAAAWAARPSAELLATAPAATGPVFSTVFPDPATGQPRLLVGAYASTGLVAVGVLSPDELASAALAELAATGSAVSVWVVDDAHRLIYRAGPPAPNEELAQHTGVAEALQGTTGATYVRVGNSEHVVAYSPVAPVGWALLLEEPWETVDSPLLQQTQAAPLILVPVVLVALVALALGIRQIVLPLRRLAAVAGELGRGRFEAVGTSVGGIAEIQSLQAELARMAQEVQSAQQSLRGYASAVTRGQEDERRRLARELHDGPVQALIALGQRVQLVQLKLTSAAPEVSERLVELRQMTGALLADLRRVIHALRPMYLEDLGLLPALEMLARDLESATRLPVQFTCTGAPVRLSAEREIAAYRFAQEALSNVARHSQATHAEVTATFEPSQFVLRVSDNGRGFVPPEHLGDLTAESHFGLLGMQERAELVAGEIALHSVPGQGTQVELRLPLTA